MTEKKKKRAFSLASGKEENKSFRRCKQTQCGYYVNGGCKSCDTCSAKPFILDKSCDACYDCENVPDALRFGDKKKKEANKINISNEELHAEMLAAAMAELMKKKILEAMKEEKEPDIIIERR